MIITVFPDCRRPTGTPVAAREGRCRALPAAPAGTRHRRRSPAEPHLADSAA